MNSSDDVFGWSQTGRLDGDGWVADILHMTSQRWLPSLASPAIWSLWRLNRVSPDFTLLDLFFLIFFGTFWGCKDVAKPWLRNHTLALITPNDAKQEGPCLLYIALGFYGSELVPSQWLSSSDKDLLAAAEIAKGTGRPAAVLFNVPAEFLKLNTSSPLVEDATLSESWALFREEGILKPTLLELPMTKATVKAMDALGEFAQLQSFVLMGASKRGNLCWHTASVDPRVTWH